MSKALQHCGYEAEDMADGGFAMKLSTPYEGATVEAMLSPRSRFKPWAVKGRDWCFTCEIKNNRGTTRLFEGSIFDCGRYVAKSMLRSMALELRRAYTHRGQKIRKRAIARAKAKAAQEGGAE